MEVDMKTDTNVAHLIKTTIINVTFMTVYTITQHWRDITQCESDTMYVIKLLVFIDLLSVLRKTLSSKLTL